MGEAGPGEGAHRGKTREREKGREWEEKKEAGTGVAVGLCGVDYVTVSYDLPLRMLWQLFRNFYTFYSEYLSTLLQISSGARVTPPPPPPYAAVQLTKGTPPSLYALFENFDCCIRLGRPPQGGSGGGLLVGVAVNGLPLAEPPLLEIFGPTEMVFSSTQEADDHVVRGTVLSFLFSVLFSMGGVPRYLSCLFGSPACALGSGLFSCCWVCCGVTACESFCDG